MATILIIDDDDLMCQSLSHVARRRGHEPTCVHTIGAGLETARNGSFDVVFLDVRMPDGNGLDLLPKIRGAPSAPEIVIMTGYGDPRGAELAIKSGAWDYIEKGASIKEITLSLVRALEYRRQKKGEGENRNVVALKRDDIIGSSNRLNECLDMVAQAAECDASVLVTGETGTGKELFARAVHYNSRRARGSFVVVDCAALPETLIESVLFGHVKGAFTGAEQAREGLVRQADGGTLFLDEVGELPLSMQKSFLRVLQEHRFRTVGGQQEIDSDFRLVAATNRNLDLMVQKGQFREDLLFRLRSFVIELPALRERPEDVKELARHYLDKLCDRYGLSAKGFSPEFLKTLTSYPWPGNVREFLNALERTVAAARCEPILFPMHLPTSIRVQVAQAQVNHDVSSDPQPETKLCADLPKLHEYRETVYAQAEKQYLQDLMSLSANSIPQACRLSGLSPSRLYALLKSHELSRP